MRIQSRRGKKEDTMFFIGFFSGFAVAFVIITALYMDRYEEKEK